MFNRFAKIARLLPALVLAPTLYHQKPLRLDSSINTPFDLKKLTYLSNSKIRYVDDLALFMGNELSPNTVYIIFEIKEDDYINEQVVEIANQFIS